MGQFSKAGNPQAYLFDPTDTIPAGALVRWNTVTGKVTTLAASANFAAFIGVSEFQVPQSSPIDNTAAGNVSGNTNMGLVRREGIFPFKTTAAQTYVHGDSVKRGADDLTVSVSGTEVIGYVNLPNGSTITGAAGVTVPIEIKSNFGSPTILSA